MVFVYTRYPIDETRHVMWVLSGLLALTAMLLPGVSGALVLLTLGLYDEIVSYVHNMEVIPLMYFLIIEYGIVGASICWVILNVYYLFVQVPINHKLVFNIKYFGKN